MERKLIIIDNCDRISVGQGTGFWAWEYPDGSIVALTPDEQKVVNEEFAKECNREVIRKLYDEQRKNGLK